MTATVSSQVRAARPPRRMDWQRIIAIAVIVAMAGYAVYSLTTIDFSISNTLSSLQNARRFFASMGGISLPPISKVLQLTGLTVGLVLLGTLVAAVISVPVSWLAASNTAPNTGLRWLGRAIGVLTRAVPDVVLALIFALIFSLGTLPGIFAIGIHSIGMISKLFADAIEQTDEGPRLAIRAAGGSRLQEFTSGVVPQVLPAWIAVALHRFDINLRGSVVLGYVGVSGLGYQMSLDFRQFMYGQGIGLAIVTFVLCVLMEIISSTIRRNLLGIEPTGSGIGDRLVRAATRDQAAARPAAGTTTSPAATPQSMLKRPWTRSRIRNTTWSWIAVAVIIASIFLCDIHWSDFVNMWGYVPQTVAGFWPPNAGAYGYGIFAQALITTIRVAFGAALLTFVFSLVFGSFAARNVAPNGIVRGVFRVVLVIIRGVPELILAILLIVITGLGLQAGTIALAFGGIGLLGKLIADSFEEVPSGPERALRAVGATRPQVYTSATLPQGLRSLIGNSLYLVDTNIRSATILGIVGGGGIGYYLLTATQSSTHHPQVTTIVFMILVTVLVLEGIAMWMRRVFR